MEKKILGLKSMKKAGIGSLILSIFLGIGFGILNYAKGLSNLRKENNNNDVNDNMTLFYIIGLGIVGVAGIIALVFYIIGFIGAVTVLTNEAAGTEMVAAIMAIIMPGLFSLIFTIVALGEIEKKDKEGPDQDNIGKVA